jgi:hypothetical protein
MNRAVYKAESIRQLQVTDDPVDAGELDQDDRCFLTVVDHLPGPEMDTLLGAAVVLSGRGIVQIAEKKMVGDRGLEPLTSTVCRKRGKIVTVRK